jgi:hypothetical protein
MAARSLHRQIVMDRRIVATEQTDLHLVWAGSRIFIKPLPRYLLSKEFWANHLCGDRGIYGCAKGLLLSYAWLVGREIDFRMATSEALGLLPSDLTWAEWKSFLEDFLENVNLDDLEDVNRRYRHGELREGRLNMIYRLALLDPIRGYFYRYHHYSTLLRNNFAWLIVTFAYVSIILTAMQVGLATERLQRDERFQRASFGLAVLSIVVPAISAGAVFILFLVLSADNIIATIKCVRSERGERKKRKANP